MSLYKEKRFTKLGYLAGAVYDCLPYFKQILVETPLNNLLVRACRLYVNNDFIVAGFKALANFTYKVTMPYLNFIEKSNLADLVRMLPKLYIDLADCKLDTMADYSVKWTHVKITTSDLLSELDKYLLHNMCINAAKGVKLQCFREYWDQEDSTKRATQLHKLTSQQLAGLPTNNIVTERYLATFGYLASLSAKRSNRFFKAIRIRDDLMFWGSNSNASKDIEQKD